LIRDSSRLFSVRFHSQQKTYDFSSTATPNRPLRGLLFCSYQAIIAGFDCGRIATTGVEIE